MSVGFSCPSTGEPIRCDPRGRWRAQGMTACHGSDISGSLVGFPMEIRISSAVLLTYAEVGVSVATVTQEYMVVTLPKAADISVLSTSSCQGGACCGCS